MIADHAEALKRIAQLEAKLVKVMLMHGDGGWCQLCGCAWACPTWRAAAGVENSEPEEE